MQQQTDAPSEGRSLSDTHMMLYRAFHAQTNFLRPRMAKIGLGPGQPKILGYLGVNGPCSQRTLAEYFELDPAAVSRMLASLSQSGFVRMTQGEDRRTRLAEVTGEGRAALAEWDRCCDEEGATMLAGFSPDEVAQLQDYLTRIHANLRRTNRATAPDGEAL